MARRGHDTAGCYRADSGFGNPLRDDATPRVVNPARDDSLPLTPLPLTQIVEVIKIRTALFCIVPIISRNILYLYFIFAKITAIGEKNIVMV
jgi:hypothetical protein